MFSGLKILAIYGHNFVKETLNGTDPKRFIWIWIPLFVLIQIQIQNQEAQEAMVYIYEQLTIFKAFNNQHIQFWLQLNLKD